MERKVINGFGRLCQSLNGLWNHKALVASIIIAIVISSIYIIFNWSGFSIKSSTFFADFIDPTITILTFLTALLIGFYNLHSNWKNSLEKRLTVFFIFYYDTLKGLEESCKEIKDESKKARKEREIEFIKSNNLQEKTSYLVMMCDEAILAHEGDIRNWGQQLGRQLALEQFLEFHPFFTLGSNDDIVRIELANKIVYTKQYLLYFFLESIPKYIMLHDFGRLSTDNYDDSPTSKLYKFNIREIDVEKLKDYSSRREFIDSLINNQLEKSNKTS